jgi:uncharacterized protein YjbI with pentapeptide repeats
MPQDYSGQNLRGRDFKGQDLTGANFSGADIRGANFTNANLTGANFSHAQAGLQRRWVVFLLAVSWLISVLSLLFLALLGVLVSQIFDSFSQIAGWAILILLISFLITIISEGLNVNLVLAFVIVTAFAFALFGAVFTLAGAYTGAVVLAFSILTLPIAGVLAFTVSIAFAISSTAAGYSGWIITALVFAFAIIVSIFFVEAKIIVFATVFVLFSAYVPYLAIKGNEKHSLIRYIGMAFAATAGTNFSNADLTDANFTQSTLRSTDLRKARLIRTCFYKTKMLQWAHPGKSYLENTQLRQLLITRKKQNLNKEQILNFDREDLRGVNLQGAYLQDTSFIGANLSAANLQDADLSRAKLVKTQLDGTNFTGACLTGAFIEDWNITQSTNFQSVRCEYIFMRLPTNEDPDPHRKPDNRNEIFQDGDFGDFIKPIFDTLDLYHNQNVDPRAVAISFKRLAENHPNDEISIAAVEVKGDDKLLLRAKTAPTADKSELSQEYFATYNQLQGLPESQIKLLLQEKDNRIRSLENMITTALQSPSFYAQTYQNQGDTMSNAPKKASQNTFNAPVSGFVDADTVNAQQIGGDIHQSTSEQRQNLAAAAKEIQQLLEQLAQTYPTTTQTEKMIVMTKAVETIEQNPTLKARVIGALKAGGVETFKELIDHPLVNILVATLEGWQQPD